MACCIISGPIVNLPYGQAERDELFCSNIYQIADNSKQVPYVIDFGSSESTNMLHHMRRLL